MTSTPFYTNPKGIFQKVVVQLQDNNNNDYDSNNPLPVNLPANASTESTQLELKSLIETLQELNSRLTILSAVKGANETLRITGISMPSTAVTGPITSAQFIAAILTQRIAIENNTAILSNINNVVIS